eukprot:Nitzschia sp. Nitz4//scaffold4_size323378//225114//227129//NITZ4_000688-RA/size323378-processed-gene-0.215-mRNA-1//-1//CDS//3329553483//736//frame0
MPLLIEVQGDKVHDILIELVTHYNQPIHVVEVAQSNSTNDAAPAVSNGIAKYWVDRLRDLPKSNVCEWLLGYEKEIQPILLRYEPGAAAVLKGYDLVLRGWLDEEESNRVAIAEFERSDLPKLSSVVTALARDLFLMLDTAHLPESGYAPDIRSRSIIPSLLRILNQTLKLAIDVAHHTSQQLLLNSDDLMTCAICLLSLKELKFGPRLVAPMLCHRAESASCEETKEEIACSSIPPDSAFEDMYHRVILEDSESWEELEIDGFPKLDKAGEADIFRESSQVWQQLSILSTRFGSNNTSDQRKSVAMDVPLVNQEEKASPSTVINTLGVPQVARALRVFVLSPHLAHGQETVVEDLVIMGRRVRRPQLAPSDGTNKMASSRILATLNFVRSIDFVTSVDTQETLRELVPVCLQLLDSLSKSHAALGVSVLFQLLEMIKGPRAWDEYEDELFSKLDSTFTVHREGPIVLLIGRTQFKLLSRQKESSKRIRQLCQRWLARLHDVSQGAVVKNSRRLILQAGVVPFLHQLSCLPNAQGIEIGRLGLTTLLPLVLFMEVEDKTRFAAMIALINLMHAAFPMMHHHGGKMMCHFLGAFDVTRSTDCTKDEKCLRDVALHCAALCLVICGERAQAILDEVKSEEGKYQAAFVQHVLCIQVRAQVLCQQFQANEENLK